MELQVIVRHPCHFLEAQTCTIATLVSIIALAQSCLPDGIALSLCGVIKSPFTIPSEYSECSNMLHVLMQTTWQQPECSPIQDSKQSLGDVTNCYYLEQRIAIW